MSETLDNLSLDDIAVVPCSDDDALWLAHCDWLGEKASWTPSFFRRIFPEAFPKQATARIDKADALSRCDVALFLDALGIRFRRSGDRLSFLCPFHREKTPSCSFSVSRKLWFCHGCGAGGDAFSFVMTLEGIAFPEAVARVSSLCG